MFRKGPVGPTAQHIQRMMENEKTVTTISGTPSNTSTTNDPRQTAAEAKEGGNISRTDTRTDETNETKQAPDAANTAADTSMGNKEQDGAE